MKRLLVAFDFDGTLTCGDTLLPWLRHVAGTWGLLKALLLSLPWIAGWKFRLMSNSRAKERLFAMSLKGRSEAEVRRLSEEFAITHQSLLRPNAVATVNSWLAAGATVCVVSASMELWVRPMLKDCPGMHFITTRPEVKDGFFTGRFSTPNCYGSEKVTRLKAAFPNRGDFTLIAFGDSKGDAALLRYADVGYYRELKVRDEVALG